MYSFLISHVSHLSAFAEIDAIYTFAPLSNRKFSKRFVKYLTRSKFVWRSRQPRTSPVKFVRSSGSGALRHAHMESTSRRNQRESAHWALRRGRVGVVRHSAALRGTAEQFDICKTEGPSTRIRGNEEKTVECTNTNYVCKQNKTFTKN